MLTRSKVRGMLVGGAIGDALGAPVETWPPDRIAEVHGGPVRRYVSPIGHKWFKPEEFLPGMTTDDTQLTVATAEGLIHGHAAAVAANSFSPYLDAVAAAHVEAMKFTVGGWGRSTTEAVRRLANGVHWSESGKTTQPNRGTGNGVVMKISPLAAWVESKGSGQFFNDPAFRLHEHVVEYSAMTHYTQISAYAAVAHIEAMRCCLLCLPNGVTPLYFHKKVCYDPWHISQPDSRSPYRYGVGHLEPPADDLFARLATLSDIGTITRLGVPELAKLYGGGSCYVYDSLPFAYALFLKFPSTLEGVIEAANAGGDSDTNAKIVGEMLGANHGIEFFEQPEYRWSLEGLRDVGSLLAVADAFCDTFDVP